MQVGYTQYLNGNQRPKLS
uniref:Uncharacterized protein n=1 Tax=Arundo donax TaxID=35708 RepID=A0A0A8ZQ51_ARUDO